MTCAVEIKVSNAHANSENTFNPKKSPAKAKAKILEGDEDKHFKPDHFEKAPKSNPSHIYSTAAAKPDTPLTSTTRAGKHEGRIILTGAISKDSEIVLNNHKIMYLILGSIVEISHKKMYVNNKFKEEYTIETDNLQATS